MLTIVVAGPRAAEQEVRTALADAGFDVLETRDPHPVQAESERVAQLVDVIVEQV